MATPYIGEIRIAGFNFAPLDWALCDGTLLSITQYSALFNLIGTTYGGDGIATFALPDLRSRVPVHQGEGFVMGQVGGSETVQLSTREMPGHEHLMVGANVYGNESTPKGTFPAQLALTNAYATIPNAAFPVGAITSTGGGTAHNNMQPFLVLNYFIALFGVFPSQD